MKNKTKQNKNKTKNKTKQKTNKQTNKQNKNKTKQTNKKHSQHKFVLVLILNWNILFTYYIIFLIEQGKLNNSDCHLWIRVMVTKEKTTETYSKWRNNNSNSEIILGITTMDTLRNDFIKQKFNITGSIIFWSTEDTLKLVRHACPQDSPALAP